MVKERLQLFEAFNAVDLTYMINEFLTNLPDTHFKYNYTIFQEPSWLRAVVFYEAIKLDEEMAVEGEKRMAEMQGMIKQIETEEESKKVVTDDDLKVIVQQNTDNSKEDSVNVS